MQNNEILENRDVFFPGSISGVRSKLSAFYLLGVISTFLIIFQIRIAGISVSKYVALFFGVYFFYKNGWKVKTWAFKQNYAIFFGTTILCVAIILIGSSPYKEYSIRSIIDFLFVFFLCFALASSQDRDLELFLDGIRVSCIVQIIWCMFQIVAWYGLKIDINKAIFVDGLKVLAQASKLTSDGSTLCISGLSHHPSNLIVVILLTLTLFDKPWRWAVGIFIAFMSRNSTTILAIAVCMLLFALPHIFDILKKRKSNRKALLLILGMVVVIPVFLYLFGGSVFRRIGEVLIRLKQVLDGKITDGSTFAHTGYYTFLPEVWKRIDFKSILFGYSYGWTGGMFFIFFGEEYGKYFTHSFIKAGVECDPMNFIYGIGIIGTLSFYKWLAADAIRGAKINRKYTILLLSIMASGIFYAIQYSYVIVLEVVLSELIRRKLNVI